LSDIYWTWISVDLRPRMQLYVIWLIGSWLCVVEVRLASNGRATLSNVQTALLHVSIERTTGRELCARILC
jgi:hypothetical protein